MMKSFYLFACGMILVILTAAFPHIFGIMQQPEKPVAPVSAPAPTRSLEKIDQWNSLGDPHISLWRVGSCHYIILDGTHPAIVHLESCPSPSHRQQTWGILNHGEPAHPGDPIIGRPLGERIRPGPRRHATKEEAMKVTLEFDYDKPLARAVAIQNGGRGLAQSHEVAQWAKETLAVSSDILVQEMRESMEEGEPS